MTTARTWDHPESSLSGLRRRSPATARGEEDPARDSTPPSLNTTDSEILYRAGVNKTPNRIVVTIGFLIMMGIIGSAAGLAWRTHVDLAAFADMQPEVNELQAAVQRLELMQQQIAQSVYALQQLQQKNEQTRIVDVHRLSDQLTSLQGEMDKIEKSTVQKEPPKRNSASAAPKNETLKASVGAPR